MEKNESRVLSPYAISVDDQAVRTFNAMTAQCGADRCDVDVPRLP